MRHQETQWRLGEEVETLGGDIIVKGELRLSLHPMVRATYSVENSNDEHLLFNARYKAVLPSYTFNY